MTYIVVTGDSANELSDNVNSRIADGYRLQGVYRCALLSMRWTAIEWMSIPLYRL